MIPTLVPSFGDSYKKPLAVPRLFVLPLLFNSSLVSTLPPRLGVGAVSGVGAAVALPLHFLASLGSPPLWSSCLLWLLCLFVVVSFLSASSLVLLRAVCGKGLGKLVLTVVRDQAGRAGFVVLNPSA